MKLDDRLDRLTHKLIHTGTGQDGLTLGSYQPITLGYAEIVTGQGSITTTTDITGLSVTVTVPAGRRIKITAETAITSSVATDGVDVQICEGGTVLQDRTAKLDTNAEVELHTHVIVSPSAGTHTYKLRASRFAGTGTATIQAASNKPASILVEDITGSSQAYESSAVPVGVLAQAINTVGFAGITTVVTLLSVNIVVPAGRTLKISGGANVIASTTGARLIGAFTLDGPDVGRWIDRTAGINGYNSASDFVLVSPTAGAHTIGLTLACIAAGSASVEAGTTEPVHLVVEDVTPTPASASGAPSSTLAYAEITANVGGLGTPATAIPGLSVTVTVPAGRRLRISTRGVIGASTTTDQVNLRIYESGVQIGEGPVQATLAGRGYAITAEAVISPSAGTHTYSIVAGSDTGTPSVTFYANPNSKAFILVEDISGSSIGAHTHTEFDDTGWISLVPLLVNGWVSYDNTYGPPRYRKLRGVVYLQGLIRSGTLGVTVATLPVGFRTSMPKLLFTTMGNSDVINRYDVDSSGNVICATSPSNLWNSLNGITYPADQ